MRSHCLHPTQRSLFPTAIQLSVSIDKALTGQRITHSWHPAHRSAITVILGEVMPVVILGDSAVMVISVVPFFSACL
ncbi:MAG: hypothetical protein M1483_03190 [Actinobacteria bacterium]|nr:hypothetical protein [Actinomycetota bacterium]MCL6104630.1 hypothetical protein [Actinomycetota bacterium]